MEAGGRHQEALRTPDQPKLPQVHVPTPHVSP